MRNLPPDAMDQPLPPTGDAGQDAEPSAHQTSLTLSLRGSTATPTATDWNAQDTPQGPLRQPWENLYRHARWTADGTSIIASSWSNSVDCFVLPADLLEANAAQYLESYSKVPLPAPTSVLAACPAFSLADPATQTALVGCRDHPIQLYPLFPNSEHVPPLASYRVIKHETEQFLRPHSLLWLSSGHHFLSGSMGRLDYFDMTREGEDGLLVSIATMSSRRGRSRGGISTMPGAVSCLSTTPADDSGAPLIAAGTWSRWLGLYDISRSTAAVATWSVRDACAANFGVSIGGTGIVQTEWSPCGRYLVVNERASSGILVYDIRVTRRPLSALVGRAPNAQQPLRCDVFPIIGEHSNTFEVWAGTGDGSVLVWNDVAGHGDTVEKTWSWKSHASPVTATILHPGGSVVATCGGAWTCVPDDKLDSALESRSSPNSHQLTSLSQDTSLKIWEMLPETSS